jgi:hypothetical protein
MIYFKIFDKSKNFLGRAFIKVGECTIASLITVFQIHSNINLNFSNELLKDTDMNNLSQREKQLLDYIDSMNDKMNSLIGRERISQKSEKEIKETIISLCKEGSMNKKMLISLLVFTYDDYNSFIHFYSDSKEIIRSNNWKKAEEHNIKQGIENSPEILKKFVYRK